MRVPPYVRGRRVVHATVCISRQFEMRFDTPAIAVYLRSTISPRSDKNFRNRRFVMALWKDETSREPGGQPAPAAKPPEKVSVLSAVSEPAARPAATQNRAEGTMKESIIAAGVTIEGKIEGAGHVRIAGDFNGGVKADTVVVGGQLDGNIDAASRVELLQTGVLNGELKAGSLTVAAGSRMR